MHAPQQHEAQVGVLIVDDHDGYRSIATEVVKAASGFEVVGCATSRAEALRCMHDYHGEVDLVLMDINLGVEDGVSLSEELAAEPEHPDIVLVSAMAFDDLPLAARSCGARGYLPKAELSPLALSQVCAGVYDWPHGSTSHSPR